MPELKDVPGVVSGDGQGVGMARIAIRSFQQNLLLKTSHNGFLKISEYRMGVARDSANIQQRQRQKGEGFISPVEKQWWERRD